MTATGKGPLPSGRTTKVVISPSAVGTWISFSTILTSCSCATVWSCLPDEGQPIHDAKCGGSVILSITATKGSQFRSSKSSLLSYRSQPLRVSGEHSIQYLTNSNGNSLNGVNYAPMLSRTEM